MNNWFLIYLLVVGSLAGLVLVAPAVVLIGYFLLIVPGALLSIMPTVFLWSAPFALFWFVSSRYLEKKAIAALVAFVCVPIALSLLPIAAQHQANTAVKAQDRADVISGEKIESRGHLRIDLPQYEYVHQRNSRLAVCSSLCLGLLFVPGVESVTINSAAMLSAQDHLSGLSMLDAGARTFRLVPRAECGDNETQPVLRFSRNGFGKTLADQDAIEALWLQRLSSDLCLISEAVRAKYDQLYRYGDYWSPPGEGGRWLLGASGAKSRYVEIVAASGEVLFRRTSISATAPGVPLVIWMKGGVSDFGFGWVRRTLRNAKYDDDLDFFDEIADRTILRDRTEQKRTPAEIAGTLRVSLMAALSNSTVAGDAPIFDTIGAYVDAMAKGARTDQDIEIVTALIRDRRIVKRFYHYKIPSVFEDHSMALREAIADRLYSTEDVSHPSVGWLVRYHMELSPGIFATLTDKEEWLLSDKPKRMLARGLISRLADQGEKAVPRLLVLLEHHGRIRLGATKELERLADESRFVSQRKTALLDLVEEHDRILDSVKSGFCGLGPEAREALSKIEALTLEGVVPEHFAQDDHWLLTLYRMGKPLESIRKPNNLSGTEGEFHSVLKAGDERFDPKRWCGFGPQ